MTGTRKLLPPTSSGSPEGSRRRHGKALATVGSAMALALLAAACSSSPSPSATVSTPGVTNTSITIGATVPLTGPAAPGYSEIAPAVQAVFAWANAHGGVNGRKIDYTYLDDAYNAAKTAPLTRQLVLQNKIFADVGSLGTPTQLAVQSYLNSQKVPQLFIESGCNCWSEPQYPYSLGWQPPYTVEGKILGYYIAQHFAGKKIGYLYQGDEFGQDVVKGLDMEIPASAVVSRQTYDAATLAGPLSNQMAALKSAGAQVVVLATVPAATALAMLPAAAVGYIPQYVVDSVGADAPTVGPLLSSFTTQATHSAAEAQAATGLLANVITDSYLPTENDTSNAWIKVTAKLLRDYAPSLWAAHGLDGNDEYGVALGYTFVQALQAAGKNLTRTGLIDAIDRSGASFVTPGLVPLSYSSGVHFGFEGAQVVQYKASAPPAVTPTGSWIGATPVSPVYTTSPGSGPIRTYTGATKTPPTSLSNTD
ncbi:MAG TPA: ABC transporter substrate-binding protein [Acidimicrobiales bacterium]|nr:ABC transporter substrate-binding protein [Acidimicrobiales bacterium]